MQPIMGYSICLFWAGELLDKLEVGEQRICNVVTASYSAFRYFSPHSAIAIKTG